VKVGVLADTEVAVALSVALVGWPGPDAGGSGAGVDDDEADLLIYYSRVIMSTTRHGIERAGL